MVKAFDPVECLADRLGGGAGKHGNGQKTGADDAAGEDCKREAAGDRAKRLGRLRRTLDICNAVGVQRRRGGEDDEQRDQVRMTQPMRALIDWVMAMRG